MAGLVTLQWTGILILHTLLLALFIPLQSAVQGLKKFSKMQLHWAATRAFGYTVHDGSLHADCRWRSDYVTTFHLAGRLPFQDSHSRPCDTWHHLIRLPVNNRFPQNDYRFCLKNGFNTTIFKNCLLMWYVSCMWISFFLFMCCNAVFVCTDNMLLLTLKAMFTSSL